MKKARLSIIFLLVLVMLLSVFPGCQRGPVPGEDNDSSNPSTSVTEPAGSEPNETGKEGEEVGGYDPTKSLFCDEVSTITFYDADHPEVTKTFTARVKGLYPEYDDTDPDRLPLLIYAIRKYDATREEIVAYYNALGIPDSEELQSKIDLFLNGSPEEIREAFHHPMTVYHEGKIYPIRDLYALYAEDPGTYNAIPSEDTARAKEAVRAYYAESYADDAAAFDQTFMKDKTYRDFLGFAEPAQPYQHRASPFKKEPEELFCDDLDYVYCWDREYESMRDDPDFDLSSLRHVYLDIVHPDLDGTFARGQYKYKVLSGYDNAGQDQLPAFLYYLREYEATREEIVTYYNALGIPDSDELQSKIDLFLNGSTEEILKAFHHPMTVYYDRKIYLVSDLFTLSSESPEVYDAIPAKDVEAAKKNLCAYYEMLYSYWNLPMEKLLGKEYAAFLGYPIND